MKQSHHARPQPHRRREIHPTAPDGFARNVYYDRTHAVDAAKLLPGEYYVTSQDMLIVTVLGSCVAACIRDPQAAVGGMNHFMLPECDLADPSASSARYGVYAMEVLINELLKRGARRERLEAKVFGGGQVMRNFSTMNVGERNVRFVEQFLAAERITIVSHDVLDVHPRKVCLFPGSARALCKKLASTQVDAIVSEESAFRGRLGRQPASAGAGSVELF